MQGKILFVGCSHTNGFHWNEETGDKWIWQDNNYAKIYAEELADSQCYIYSSSGAPNSKFPRYIRHMLNEHPDITAISIQSTYWDRWVMANNINLQFKQVDPGYFTRKYSETDSLICYDDFNTIDYNTIEWNEKVKWDSVGMYEEGCPELNGGYDWPGFETSYTHMKFHTEIVTHLRHEEYCKDIALIDSIVDIPVYVWRINDRVQFPENFETYKKLTNVKIFRTPANIWLKDNIGTNIEDMKVDEEHYNTDAHNLIAHNFIPELLHGTT